MNKRYLEAGKIINTHAVAGEVKIQPWADSANFLLEFDSLYIDGREFPVESSRVHKNCLIAKLEGVDGINDAMSMKNKVVFIDRQDAVLPDGGFFIQDILGASVVSESGEEIGKLADVFETPASNIYVVHGESERLIPAVPEFILNTDIEGGVITVRLIEGM